MRFPFVSRYPSVVFSLWLLAASLTGCDAPTAVDHSHSEPATDVVVAGTVQLLVDFSGQQRDLDVKVPCSADSTVFTILQRAEKMGDLEFDSQGAGSTAFVHSIDGVLNKGGRGKNWVFRVNDQLAKESCGSLGVAPGDVIEWKYGEYEPELDEPELE